MPLYTANSTCLGSIRRILTSSGDDRTVKNYHRVQAYRFSRACSSGDEKMRHFGYIGSYNIAGYIFSECDGEFRLFRRFSVNVGVDYFPHGDYLTARLGISIPIVDLFGMGASILTPAGAARQGAISSKDPINLFIFTPRSGFYLVSCDRRSGDYIVYCSLYVKAVESFYQFLLVAFISDSSFWF